MIPDYACCHGEDQTCTTRRYIVGGHSNEQGKHQKDDRSWG
jgi:hypothetical protein